MTYIPPAPRKQEYQMISEGSPYVFNQELRSYVTEGWSLHGDLIVTDVKDNCVVYSQMMVRSK